MFVPLQLVQHAVLTLPVTTAGTRSRLPKAERLIPEKLRSRWPSPVTWGFCYVPNRQPLTANTLLLHICTSRRRVAHLHLSHDAVPSLPVAFRPTGPLINESTFQVSGLGRREPGSGVQVRVQVQDLNFAPHPHLYLITRT